MYEYMFLNCDKHKSYESMNPTYNNVVYRKRAGRRALWRKIKQEVENGNIEIDENNMTDVRLAILGGNPCEVNDLMTYGVIVQLEIAS